MYIFIENIESALRGDLALFNKYLQLIDSTGGRSVYRFIDVAGAPVSEAPAPSRREA